MSRGHDTHKITPLCNTGHPPSGLIFLDISVKQAAPLFP